MISYLSKNKNYFKVLAKKKKLKPISQKIMNVKRAN